MSEVLFITMEFDKPFKNYDELLSLLESRNVIIKDKDAAKNALSDYSYYYLVNGFQDYFSKNGELYEPSVYFDDFLTIMFMESDLNNLLLKYILVVERSFNSKLSYRISEQYGVHTDINIHKNTDTSDYLSIYNYKATKYRDNTIINIKKDIIEYSNNTLSVAHYLSKHNHLPFWVAINCVKFRHTIQLYQTMFPDDKNYIVDRLVLNTQFTLEEKKDFTTQGLELLREYRNKFAHGQRAYQGSFSNKLSSKSIITITNGAITKKEYKTGIGHSDKFAVIIVLLVMLHDKSRISFIEELSELLYKYNNTVIAGKSRWELFGLPNNLFTIINNYCD